MRVLGISAFHRDSAAALVVDGRLVCAAREERFTRKLGDGGFPWRSARSCLQRERIHARDLDRVVFYEKPLRKFERLLASQLRAFPRSAGPFARTMFLWLGDRLWTKNRIASMLEVDPERIAFVHHQAAHAASAYFPSPFEHAAVLTLDDGGEWATASLASGKGSTIETLSELHHPHSLGLFSQAIAQFLGFEPAADQNKLEDLAGLGRPRFEREMNELVRADGDGSFSVDSSCFRFHFDSVRLFDERLSELLGPARVPGSVLRMAAPDTRDADVAASLQAVLEERALDLCRALIEREPCENLCFAGSLAHNRSLNARILRDGPFERLFVPPWPGEDGAAIGAALLVAHSRSSPPSSGAYSGYAFPGEGIDDPGADAAPRLEAGQAALELARRLLAGQCVAWVRGRMELGSESLGHRSLLADPRAPDAGARLLGSVQRSEPYLTARLLVPEDRAAEFFDLPPGAAWPLRFAQLRVPATAATRHFAPGAVRADGTARPQVVHAGEDPELHRLLTAFGAEAGAPLVMHATFKLRGMPMVRTRTDALEAFGRSALDCLVVEDRLYEPGANDGGA